MAPRTLKGTTSRKKSSEFVESAVVIHGAGIGSALGEKLSEDLREGEEMPDISFLLDLMARRMGRFRQRLLDAAEAHIEELAADDAMRKQRDDAMDALTRAYVTTRQTVADGYSPEDAAALGFETNVATEPAMMEVQIERLLTNFAKPEVEELRPIISTVNFVPSEGEPTFRPHLDKLIEARAALNREKRKADETLLAKNDAVEDNDREFGQISRCIETTFAFAGQEELAKRVRATARRPGTRPDVEDRGEDESPPLPQTEPADGSGDPSNPPAGDAGTTEEAQEGEAVED